MGRKSQKTEKKDVMNEKKVTEETVGKPDATGGEAGKADEQGNGTTEPFSAATSQQKGYPSGDEAVADEPGVTNEPSVAGADTDESAAGEAQGDITREQELENKLAELQDKYLRLSAEYDNYRKRTLREKIELQEVVREDVFINILSVVDDLERAMEAVKGAKDIEAVKSGMELIHSKFTKYLNGQGVKEIDAIGKNLDTDQHEAITKIPVENKKKKGKVVDVVEKGYTLRDRVIRFAKVVIGE